MTTGRIGLLAGALTVALAAPAWGQASQGAVDCYEEARRQPGVTDLEAIRLCREARSTAPADCYVQAREHTLLGSYDSLRLCTYAQSTAPAECAMQAERETTLDHEEVLRLCGGLESWRFPY